MSEAEGRASQSVAGRITTAAFGGASSSFLRQVAGLITTAVTARIVTPPQELPVGGMISARSHATGRVLQLASGISGSIHISTSASLGTGQTTTPIARFSARITTQAKALAAASVTTPPGLLFGTITTQVSGQLGAGQKVTSVSGQISIAVSLNGISGPWQNVLVGRITTAVQAQFADAEVQTPPPPYPLPFLTYDVDHYLDLVTSEHNQRPKYMATVGISVDPAVGDQQLAASISGLFDLDYCVGQQEDYTGQWIGKSRWIELPVGFFSWDEEGLGWNQANWQGPGDATDSLERLDDYHYRLLLYANVIANHWNGSIPAAYEAWDTLFQYTGLKVIIQDYGNMTMLYGLLSTSAPDNVLLSLFTTGQMTLRPEGVELRAYALQAVPEVPFFSWDSSSDSVHGWDVGQWAIMLTPGQAYIPGVGTLWDAPPPTRSGLPSTTDTPQTHWDDMTTLWDQRRN